MKAIAVENAVYAKLLRLKSTLNQMRRKTCDIQRINYREHSLPLAFLLIDSTLMMVFRHLIYYFKNV